MRLCLIILIILFLLFEVFSQESKFFNSTGQLLADTTISISNLNSYPIMIGGEEAMIKLILENIQYPDIIIQNEIEGEFIIKILLDNNGQIVESSFIGVTDKFFKIIINRCFELLKSQEFKISDVENTSLYLPFEFALTEEGKKKYFEEGTFKIIHGRNVSRHCE